MANRERCLISGTKVCSDVLRARARRCIGHGLLVVGILCFAGAARADYRVEAGDVVEIFVAGVPELQRRVPIRMDGQISFPLVGTMAVAGLSPSQLQAKIQAALATKVYQQRTSDGREIDVVIDPESVTATIVEYRPIYVGGDVAKPGEYAYRPFMTVRQAVAMSGGIDMLRVRMTDPYLESAQLRSDYESLWTELAVEQARVWRIKSELGDKDNIDRKTLFNVPVAKSTINQIVRVEAEHLSTSEADYQRQKAFLKRSIKEGDDQISVLSQQQKKESEGVEADVAELQKVLRLYGNGALPSPRVTDSRRAVLLSSTRQLQTTAQLMQMQKQQDDLRRQLEKLDDQRKIDLLRNLQDAAGKVSGLKAKIQGVAEKLRYTSTRSRVVAGDEIKPQIEIVRKDEKGRERIAADEDAELKPGDVVEVTLRSNEQLQSSAHAAPPHLASRATDAQSPAQTAGSTDERSAPTDPVGSAKAGSLPADSLGSAHVNMPPSENAKKDVPQSPASGDRRAHRSRRP